MFLLQSTKDDAKHYIRKELTTIGRHLGDIVLTDNGVSRSHAELIVEDDKLYLISLKDQLRTSINNVFVTHKIKNLLQVGDLINFGMSFEFSVGKLEFRVATSSVTENQKTELETCLKQINTKLLSSFRPDCTHLVVPELCPSIKVICAVILNIPMVTLEFFKQICDTTKVFPNEADFRPVIKSSVYDVKDSYFQPDEKRKTLFKGKTFVFINEKGGKPMKTMISLAGGEYSLFDATLISEYSHTPRSAKYIIIHCDSVESLPVKKAVKTAYSEVCAALAASQWRTVPMQEIAFALIKCCCAVDCNPSFNRAKHLLRVVDSQDSPSRRGPLAQSTQIVNSILAKETQTQATLLCNKESMDVVIPPTYENELEEAEFKPKLTASSQALARRNRTKETPSLRVDPFDGDLTPISQRKEQTKPAASGTNNSGKQDDNESQVSPSLFLSESESNETNTAEGESMILPINKRKRDYAVQEYPRSKKAAVAEDFDSSTSETQSSWLSKSQNGNDSKRKYEDLLTQTQDDDDDDDDEFPKPIKQEVVEPDTKRQKSSDLCLTWESTNAFDVIDDQHNDQIYKTDIKDEQEQSESHTQAMENYFQYIIKYEDDIIDENATLSGKWNRRVKVEKQENTEDKLHNESLMKEYAEKYFRESIRKRLENVSLGDVEKSLAEVLVGGTQAGYNSGQVNYKKFRKTQHVPNTLRNTLIQLV